MFGFKKKTASLGDKIFNGVIIGYGGMGHSHASQLKRSPNYNFYGVWDTDPKKLEEARKEGVKAFASADEVFADPKVDFVVIATPNDFHADYTVRAAEAKKNIVCEKPVTLSAAILQTMIDAVKKNGVKFMVHQNRRWDSDYLTAKNVYDNKLVGRIYHIESRISGSNGIAADWRSLRIHGGGMLYDWGIHQIDQILNMNKGKIVGVYCDISYRQGYDADDGFTLRLYFENGDTALVDFDTNDFVGVDRWHLYGEQGTMKCGWWFKGKMIKVKSKVDGNILPVKIGNGISKTIAERSRSSIQKLRIPRKIGLWTSFYNAYYGYLTGTQPPAITTDENLRVMRVIDAAFLSNEKKQRIEVNI